MACWRHSNCLHAAASHKTGCLGADLNRMVHFVLGTRPEIVKLGPVMRELRARDLSFELVHTGQHFDDELAGNLLTLFELSVDHQYQFGAMSRGLQIGTMVSALTQLFERRRPRCVVVQGDTNSVLAAGLAANANAIPLVHVEAGLRSYDRAMPEEHNRVMVDHIADVLCAPTAHTAELLAAESVQGEVVITGNTEMDAIEFLSAPLAQSQSLARSFGLTPGRFVVSTIHRPENTDSEAALRRIVDTFAACPIDVVFAIHPRTGAALNRYNLKADLDAATNVIQTPPLDPVTLWSLLKVCAFAVSDSGGIQEDVSVLNTPMIVVRNSTERPEVLGSYCQLCRPGDDLAQRVLHAVNRVEDWRAELAGLTSPYLGPDGRSPSAEICDLLSRYNRRLGPSPTSAAATG